MAITVESIRPESDEDRWDLGGQAFGGTDAYDATRPSPEPDRIVAAYDDDRLVGTVASLDFAMTWGDGQVPCAGVSGVVVRPEDRGRGIAKAMLRESFDRMRDRGEVLAALYPTTATLYRSVGFEVAGSYEWRKVPTASVSSAVPVEPQGLRTLANECQGKVWARRLWCAATATPGGGRRPRSCRTARRP